MLVVAILAAACSKRSETTDPANASSSAASDADATKNAAPPAPEKPNIVFILADDLGIGDPGCYNPESKIETPSIDRLAAEGLRLNDAHSPSGVCSPTRYGLLTGRYAWRAGLPSGVLWGDSPLMIDPKRMTIASLLRDAGYATGAFGKWHLGLGAPPGPDYDGKLTPGPNDVGFDEFFGIPASLDMFPYVYVRNDRAVATPSEHVGPSDHRRQLGGGFWRAGPIAPGFRHIDVLPMILEQTVKFIETNAPASKIEGDERRPFFAYVPLSAPHTPWLPTDEFKKKSGAGYYGDFVMQVDATVGHILDALDRTGVADDTLVVVTSDNGSHWPLEDVMRYSHAANLHFRGQKADIHEGGHRVPFVVRWPGHVPTGATSDALVCHTDMLATFASILGQSLPDDAGEDSIDVYPVLRGVPGATGRQTLSNHSLHGMFSVREGSWKLILGRGSGGFTSPRFTEPLAGEPRGQLYNLETDPSEETNVWAEHPEIVARLEALYAGWKESGRSR